MSGITSFRQSGKRQRQLSKLIPLYHRDLHDLVCTVPGLVDYFSIAGLNRSLATQGGDS